MTEARCRPAPAVTPLSEREDQPDPFGPLLECLADLMVACRGRRQLLEGLASSEDPRARAAIAQLDGVEQDLVTVATQVAAAHRDLQHLQLI